MVLNKHGSFYIRSGWPTKILTALTKDNYIFSPNKEIEAVDEIGVGRVMIKAMRYWAVVLGLAEESHANQGVLCSFTDLAKTIYNHDLYCQDMGTLWLLHRNITLNEEKSTAWYWTFNEYKRDSFTKKEFVNDFYLYLATSGNDFSQKAIEKEFDCLKNTYVSEKGFNLNEIINENNIPFFAPLNLLSVTNGQFRKNTKRAKDIPVDILMYCIIEDNKAKLGDSIQIDIDTLLNDSKQVGQYLNLTYSSLMDLLQTLSNKGYINLVNNFGNRYIEVLTTDSNTLLNNYYNGLVL